MSTLISAIIPKSAFALSSSLNEVSFIIAFNDSLYLFSTSSMSIVCKRLLIIDSLISLNTPSSPYAATPISLNESIMEDAMSDAKLPKSFDT